MDEIIKGRIHSFETFGAADGPGVRFIVFLQGCRLRCKFCHNPDTWKLDGGEEYTADEVLAKAEKYRPYWNNGGGITVSGGEPLLQLPFLLDLFKKAKEKGINTCIDTAGNPFTREAPFFPMFEELMKYTDLLLVDVKEMNPERHKYVTGAVNENILDMFRYLSDIEKPIWLRHVLVPDLTDYDDDLKAIADFAATLKNVERIEILPYHTLGRFKWDNLGIPYALDGISPPSKERVENAEKILGIR